MKGEVTARFRAVSFFERRPGLYVVANNVLQFVAPVKMGVLTAWKTIAQHLYMYPDQTFLKKIFSGRRSFSVSPVLL